MEPYEVERKLFKNYYVHKLYSTRKCPFWYLGLRYDMVDLAAIIGSDGVQTNIKILHDSPKCRNIDTVNGFLNDNI